LEVAEPPLAGFREELEALRNHLAQTVSEDETTVVDIGGRPVRYPLSVQLLHTFGEVRSAIDLAEAIDGCIEIGS
jgi:hypothetical protein